MSADQQRVEKALLRLDFDEAKERLALLKHKAQERAGEFEATAKKLREQPETFSVNTDSGIQEYYRDLRSLIDDIKATISELQRLESTLAQCQN
jgi:hypothetical protein